MTHFYRTDRTFMTRRSGIVNHLKNGGFMTYRSFTPINNAGPSNEPVTKVLRTQYVYSTTHYASIPSDIAPTSVPGFFVEPVAPAEQTLGYWDVWGAKAQIHLNRTRKAYDGGNLVTVSFYETGSVSFRQSIESYHKFLGKPIAVGLSGSSTVKGVRLVIKIDTGVKVIESRPFFSDYFGSYYRMLAGFDVPLGATKLDVIIQLSGTGICHADISGAALAIGAYAGDIPFSDSLPDVALPSGTVIGWVGESCPAGFRAVGEDVYMHQTLGDPNAVRGNLSTGAGTVVGTLGDRGNLTVGSHTHAHVGSPSSQASTHEIEGVAFDKAKARAAKIEIDGTIYGDEVHARSRNTKNKILIDRIGPPTRGSLSLRVVPDGSSYLPHKHTFRFSEEAIEPPRVRMRLCEKI